MSTTSDKAEADRLFREAVEAGADPAVIRPRSSLEPRAIRPRGDMAPRAALGAAAMKGLDITALLRQAPPVRTRRPETVLARVNRERLYRIAARAFFAGLSAHEQGRLINRAVKRYRDAGWQYERTETTCPQRHRGKINEICFHILRLHDAVPSTRTIRRALSLTRGPKRQA